MFSTLSAHFGLSWVYVLLTKKMFEELQCAKGMTSSDSPLSDPYLYSGVSEMSTCLRRPYSLWLGNSVECDCVTEMEIRSASWMKLHCAIPGHFFCPQGNWQGGICHTTQKVIASLLSGHFKCPSDWDRDCCTRRHCFQFSSCCLQRATISSHWFRSDF